MKTSNVSERNDCLTDDENIRTLLTAAAATYIAKETNVSSWSAISTGGKAARWAETVLVV